MGKQKTTRTVGATLRPLPATWRRRIKALYRARVGGPTAPLNDEHRRTLAHCIFAEENELEHRSPLHPAVADMRAVRNVLLDDAGENEELPAGAVARLRRELGHPPRYPAVEAMAARIAGRRALERERHARGGEAAA